LIGGRQAGRRLGAPALAGRLAYGALFAVLLPALLVLWAVRLDAVLRLPAYGSAASGLAVAGLGLAVIAAGVAALWSYGHGLPMSPYPPDRLVTRGVYRLVADPIYLGAVILAVGLALAARSGAGLWIVSPVVAFAAAAFVAGYERDATRRRYGAAAAPLLRLPAASTSPPAARDRIAVWLLVFPPWLVLYEAVQHLGVPGDARVSYLPWEARLPVLPWTEAIYAAAYPFVLLAPFAAGRQRDLRRFALQGLAAMATILPFYLLVPIVTPAKPVPGAGFWQQLMRFERLEDGPAAAFPAFHVVWACLAAQLYASAWPRRRWVAWALAGAIAASCLTTGMHSLADVALGFAAYVLIARGRRLWSWLLKSAEAVAGAWAEKDFGPVRLLGHGAYAAAAATVAVAVAAGLAGPTYRIWVVATVLAGEVGAALWAQLVEGSPQLLRPYGYFGAVAGVVAGAATAQAAGLDGWLLVAAFAVAGTFAQAIGRLRCLVQGCCHGREAPAGLGMRYTHRRSRVVRLSGLGGVPLHPTPVYSMVWTVGTGCALARLWQLGAPLSLITGGYFILIGLGRFVEEHYRGEPQTAIVAGLRLYQWLAIAFVVAGAVVTTFAAHPAPSPPPLDAASLALAAGLGIVTYAAYGVDFPRSSRRFSRLV
jgi:protein-S-isoprenylcysteine O-methyltransferase Ste14